MFGHHSGEIRAGLVAFQTPETPVELRLMLKVSSAERLEESWTGSRRGNKELKDNEIDIF